MSCGARILVISPRQNLYTLTDSHEEDFVTRSAVDQKENYVKNQMRQHRGSIALTSLAALLIITNIKLYRDILSVRRDFDEVNIEREILKIKLNETQIERSLFDSKSTNVKNSADKRSKEFEKEPKEFQFLVKIPSVFSINAFNFTPATAHLNTECDCIEGKAITQSNKQGLRLQERYYNTKFEKRAQLNADRKRRHLTFERRNWRTETIIFNNPDVPLQYASSGLTLEPHGVIMVPLIITETMGDITLKLTAKFGSFSVNSDYKRILTFKGDTKYINQLLDNLKYKNMMYDAIEYTDIATIWMKGFPAVSFEIKIRRQSLDLLTARDETQEKGIVNERVTVLIKTFRRYNCLLQIVNSIRKFYPTVTIIIADDSPDEDAKVSPEVNAVKEDKHIKYFKLPEDNGWNNGRALLISQVETEYYVYCDDDFVFNTNTNLDSFLDVIEKTGFDLIGGGVGTTSLNTWRRHGKYTVKRGSSGYCVNRENGFYGTLEGFKNCQVGDVVANFFIARTLTAGTVRFDPLFKQIAHREYFLDAIGKLRIAVCPHIAVDHKPQACEGRLADYMKKRRPIGAEFQKLQNGIDELWFQRNYLACLIDVES